VAVPGDAPIAARQGRRLEAVALLEAVAHEEPVGVAQGVVDLHVELVVLALLYGVDHVVLDDLPAGRSPAWGVGQGHELGQDVRSGRIPTFPGDDAPGKRPAGARVVDDSVDLGEV